MSFSQFLDYLQVEKNYSLNTLTAYKADLESFSEFIFYEFDEEDLSKLHYSQIRNWIICLVEQGVSNRSINRKISSLKSYYRFLQKTGDIEFSPLAKHKALKTASKIQVPFSELEIKNVLDQIDTSGFDGLRDRLIVELFYTTGMRRIELIEIKLQDLDLAGKQLKILGKRQKERIVPLLPGVIANLERYLDVRAGIMAGRQESSLFVSQKGIKLYESLVYRIINNYFSRVSGKIKKSPHILRHSFATHLLNQGANLNAVKELLGHSSLAATQVYTHNSISELSRVHQMAHPRNKKAN
ncbi:tyrosine-type recombinase/integrase [Salegentibacter sp. BLCTC]|uniref:Tyrosine recombinase XerC n=1 Tax=Salegentibacter maritimus TaxID=2794347 RepID=A0ABS0TBZ9_9FLAO|nr:MULTISPECIES: tyrosine-type recombinase/integrase [Salegentibacter]MBE7639868.1 tyrosine-type recombinase/integrase [Salegentibacter sp. BLCTC]MBI6118502.1 tyrosine-type recombinase/integrase [Salegentibacter maritimus]